MSKKAPYVHSFDNTPCWTKNCSLNEQKIAKASLSKVPALGGNLSYLKTEKVGISSELAIAEAFNLHIADNYKRRGDDEITKMLKPVLKTLFKKEKLPIPVKHTAEKQNPVDFILKGNKTLSLKTNMSKSTKVSPQRIGQPTSTTFWNYFSFVLNDTEKATIKDLSYSDSAILMKEKTLEDPTTFLNHYWKNLFDCDFLIHISNIVDKNKSLSNKPTTRVYKKDTIMPILDSSKISFTQTIDTWKESCSVKYNNITIGEWQIHNNRNCFKFRFNLEGLHKSLLLR